MTSVVVELPAWQARRLQEIAQEERCGVPEVIVRILAGSVPLTYDLSVLREGPPT